MSGLRRAVKEWVGRAYQYAWHSQWATARALLLHNASPQEARTAARAAFAARA
jgi:hypothetical protein